MPSALGKCFYCAMYLRSTDIGSPKFVNGMSAGHGPPTAEEMIAYGSEPTPDKQSTHAALSPDSPRAHQKCWKWMHTVNLFVATVRRGRSAGLDERPPAVKRHDQSSTAATKLTELTNEAAAFGASCASSGEPIVELSRATVAHRA